MINEDYFLLPDLEYLYGYEQYEKKEIFIPQFPGGGQLSSSKCRIGEIYNNIFSHSASTKHWPSGSPIFLSRTIKVIGIHKGGKNYEKRNFGIFIGPIIESLKNDEDKNKYEKNEGKGEYICENGEYYIGQNLNGLSFYVICPICKSGEPRYWFHSKCKKTFDKDNIAKIDINGNLFCNGCHQMSSLINWSFRCQSHNFKKIYDMYTLIEMMQIMIIRSKNIEYQKKFTTIIGKISEMFFK